MRKLKKALVTLFVLFLLVGTVNTDVFAARTTIFLLDEQIPHCIHTSRSKRYSYASVRCYAVYPPNGGIEDTYTRIRSNVINPATSFAISSTAVLYETATTNTNISIYQGYLDLSNITITFRGNDAQLAAIADVYYNGN